MSKQTKESRIILAIEAIRSSKNLSRRRASIIYDVPESTLRDRMNGRPSQRESTPKSRKLTNLEESVIIQYILDLDSKGFPPRLSGVEDMANRLLAERDAGRVGVHWPSNFVKRHSELATRFNRKYDYQRALCEDPDIIRGWFALVQNTITKYGIPEADIYNFDETGFLMGFITTILVVTSAERQGKPKTKQPGNREWVTAIQAVNALGWAIPPFLIVKAKVHLASWYENSPLPKDWVIGTSENGWTTNERGMDWIRHFDKHTKNRTVSDYRLLILDGHGSHHSTEFELYCKENNIITLCMPPHSSHLLQPLDVGCFSSLKAAYGKQIEELMRANITHIAKEDFFSAFFSAHLAAMTKENIQGGFRGAGLVPLDPERVISQLDLRFKTPTPQNSRPGSSQSWIPKTPSNLIEAFAQTNHIKNRISRHQNSSPTTIISAVEQFAKGSMAIMHQLALLKSENKNLRKANEELSKRRRAKKIHLRQGGVLSLRDGQDLYDQDAVEQQIREEIRGRGSHQRRVELHPRRCGTCGETGHNARTCENDIETSEEEDYN